MTDDTPHPPISDVERALLARWHLLEGVPDEERYRRMFDDAMSRLPEDMREQIRAMSHA